MNPDARLFTLGVSSCSPCVRLARPVLRQRGQRSGSVHCSSIQINGHETDKFKFGPRSQIMPGVALGHIRAASQTLFADCKRRLGVPSVQAEPPTAVDSEEARCRRPKNYERECWRLLGVKSRLRLFESEHNADRFPEERAQVERVRLTMERGSQPRPRRSRRVRGLFSVSRRGGGQSPLRPRQRESTMPKPIVITLCSLAAGCIVAFAAAAFISHL